MTRGYRVNGPAFGWSVVRKAPVHVLCKECQFKTGCPLDCIGQDILVVDVGDNTGGSLQLDIHIGPLQVVESVEVVLERAVGGHRGGLVQRYAAEIEGDVLLLVDVVHDFFGLGAEVLPALSAIRVELEVGGVQDRFTAELVLGLDSLCKFEGCNGVRVVTGVAEIVLVEVNGVRKAEVLVCLHKALDDLPGSDLEVRDRVIEA